MNDTEKNTEFHKNFASTVSKFITQAESNNLKTSSFPKKFLNLDVKVSFGQGNLAKIPWISLLKSPNTTSKGIYPVYLYFKNIKKLILAYGISETNMPEQNWIIGNAKSIAEYFTAHSLGKPYRYGQSHIFKVYDANNLPSDETINNDLFKIISQYNELLKDTQEIVNTPIKNKVKVNGKFDIRTFQRDLEQSGLLFNKLLVIRFISSILSKPFSILTGLSGSGKTKLAQSFVQWLCKDGNQYKIVPVGADWTNREPLLGYPNALNTAEYVKPDSGVLQLIIHANENQELPHFLILDEMNLSHVERYFADFLSVMESHEHISLYSGNNIKDVPSKLKVPSNLFIIGTVNIDETTNMFSPKVLDRANTIEFKVSEKEMESFLSNIKSIDMKAITSQGESMSHSFLEMAERISLEVEENDEINGTLIRFFSELKKTGAEFGYRSATEILMLINQLSNLDKTLSTNVMIDIAIMQKLLPKLHGSRRKLSPVLIKLGSFCVNGNTILEKDVFDNINYNYNNKDVLYPLSLEKISRMYRSAIDNGFASYAEA